MHDSGNAMAVLAGASLSDLHRVSRRVRKVGVARRFDVCEEGGGREQVYER